MTTALLALVTAALAVAAAFGVAPASAAAPHYEGASADGKLVFFTTTERLVPGDTDSRRDVYMRFYDAEPGVEDYVTREISTGPIGGNDAYDATFEKASADGTKVFFTTAEPLVAADTDRKSDVYVHDTVTGTTTLVSVGEAGCSPACGSGPSDAGFAAADGSEVFFVTDERLAAADTDSSFDVYERNLTTGTTMLVSAGEASCAPACGNSDSESTAVLRGVSANGNRAFFSTKESLSPADTDSAVDTYARDLPSGPTALVSRGDAACAPGCGNSDAAPAVFAGSSADGSRAFFETSEGLVPADGDGANDVYERAGGATTLVSGGSASTPANIAQDNGTGRPAISADGTKVFFTSSEPLVPADTNGATDVYEWSGGPPSLVTSGTCTQGAECGSSFDAVTADGSKLLFSTTERLAASDTDSSADVYETELPAGTPTLVSGGAAGCAPACGNGAAAAIFNGASANASKVSFTSSEQLAPQDEDANGDVYVHDLGSATTTLSTPSGVCPVNGGCDVVFNGASSDGAHVFFQTEERLTAEDVDSEVDVYERDLAAAKTRLVSTGNSVVLGPATPVLTGTDPASPAESTTPRILGQADAGAAIKVYASADCSGVPVAIGTAEELAAAGIQVTVAAGSTTSFRATASDAAGDTSGCSAAVAYTQATPAPPPPPTGEGGSGTGTGGGSGSGSNGKQTKTHDGIAYVTPEARITFGPGFKTREHRPVFRFADATGQPGTSFICKLDGHGWHSCGSPVRLRPLARGAHVFKVKAVNAIGAWEAQPTKRRFKVVR